MRTLKLKPHPGQKHILRNRRRFNHIRCHRRFGKSLMLYGLLVETAGMGYPVTYITPTATEYSKRWMEFLDIFAPIVEFVRASDGQIRLTSGGDIFFGSLHRYDSLRGNHYKRAVFDESAWSPNLEDAWNYVISATLADLEGDAYFSSTPNGGNYFKTLDIAHRDDPDWAHFHIPVDSELRNPYLKAEEIERQKRTLPAIVWQQEWLAEYVDLAGALVKREWINYFDRDRLPPDLHITVGVDLAISTKTTADHTACAVVGRDSNGMLYLLDVLRTQQSFHGVLNFIEQVRRKWQADVVAIENLQYQQAVVEELALRGLPVKGVRPSRDKITRFVPVTAKIEHGKMLFSEDLPQFFWDELFSFPIAPHDDMVDALSYAVEVQDQNFGVVTI